MQKYVAKFGGSSLADAGQFIKVKNIITSNPSRRYIVASAPGKRDSKDVKVTDMLYACYTKAAAGENFRENLDLIKARFDSIIQELGLDFDITGDLAVIEKHLSEKPEKDYMASRGEYLNSKLLAAYLGFDFVDAAEIVRFKADGSFDSDETNNLVYNALKGRDYSVIPGFYGSKPDGTIVTFSRGGSDITGSLVARAVGADMYENWTDVSGMLSADPRIVENPDVIEAATYRELRELSYMGASVMHEEAVFPVRKANISMNIRNTNAPKDPGTLISSELPRVPRKNKVTGVAGKKGFSAVLIEKSSMNSEIGFASRLLSIFARYKLSIEHMPTGIDTISVVLSTADLDRCRNELLDDIQEEIRPDVLFVEDRLAMVAVVGQGMAYSRGTASRVFGALAASRINVKMIDQGSTEINIIIGVDEDDYEEAIRSLYRALWS